MTVKITLSLPKKVFEISGENVYLCYQCGKCSAGCPIADKMDYLPNQVIHFVQMNNEKALSTKMIWACAECFNCTVICPRGLDVTKVMEALRIIVLRKGIYKLDLNKVEKIEELPQIALIAASRKLTG
ncbi:MAG: 4Fe-4S dicluster domain-containing protein [Candidatus Korarchaeota archaeon]|nr:4Fe-4S dicluster domain-containing protein [Candidatus Korarchaeota archaeon]